MKLVDFFFSWSWVFCNFQFFSLFLYFLILQISYYSSNLLCFIKQTNKNLIISLHLDKNSEIT